MLFMNNFAFYILSLQRKNICVANCGVISLFSCKVLHRIRLIRIEADSLTCYVFSQHQKVFVGGRMLSCFVLIKSLST